jgi:hypothetical protein
MNPLILPAKCEAWRAGVPILGSESAKFAVFFPVSREFKGERLEPDCSLYQQVCSAEKSARMAPEIAGNGRNFAILALKADRRKCSSNCYGPLWQPFLQRASEHSGFKDSMWRMQCDHKSMMWRKRLDFCLPSGVHQRQPLQLPRSRLRDSLAFHRSTSGLPVNRPESMPSTEITSYKPPVRAPRG